MKVDINNLKKEMNKFSSNEILFEENSNIKEKIEILKNKLYKKLKSEELLYNKLIKTLCLTILGIVFISIIDISFMISEKQIWEIVLFETSYNIFTLIRLLLIITLILIISLILKESYTASLYKNLEEEYALIINQIISENNLSINFSKEIFYDMDYLQTKKILKKFKYIESTNTLSLIDDKDKYKCCNINLISKEYNDEELYDKIGFKGQFYSLETPLEITSSIRIISSEKNPLGETTNKYFLKGNKDTKIELDNLDNNLFNDNFEIYCEDNYLAKKILNYRITNFLLEFKKICPNFEIYIEKNNIIFIIETNEKLMTLPIKSKDVKKISLEEEISKLTNVFNFIKTFKDYLSI